MRTTSNLLAVEDQPAEIYKRVGINAMTNTQLLAILIGRGTKELPATEIARNLYNHAGHNLQKLARMNVDELSRFDGIGYNTALRILACLDLGKRQSAQPLHAKLQVGRSIDAYNHIKQELSCLPHEEFWIILLSRSNRVMEKVKISQGGVSGTITDIRIILQSAFSKLASAMILAHNHPSGNLKPSEADISITRKIKEAAKLMDIAVLDHIIVGDEDYSYFSFADENMM